MTLDATHDPARQSWIESANELGTEFPIQNLPFGVFETPGRTARGGVAIGSAVVDLLAAQAAGIFTGAAEVAANACTGSTLNSLLTLGNRPARELRMQLSTALSTDAPAALRDRLRPCVYDLAAVQMRMPAAVGAFTDFLCSLDHTKRMGGGTVPPAFHHLPIAYNSRATSVCVSGVPVRRPWGQYLDANATPEYGPEPSLDFELELGAYVGPANPLGEPVAIDDASSRLFGFCLLNDWSARGMQTFESLPLGPFLAKSFATTVSPWIVTADALAPFRCALPERGTNDPPAPAHLTNEFERTSGGFSIELEASILTPSAHAAGKGGTVVTRTNFRTMWWSFAQMLAHHTSNGCNLQPGDLLGSGTASGPEDASRACLAELTSRGTQSLDLDGEERVWLLDGDEVIFRGWARKVGFVPIGFGACRATVSA